MHSGPIYIFYVWVKLVQINCRRMSLISICMGTPFRLSAVMSGECELNYLICLNRKVTFEFSINAFTQFSDYNYLSFKVCEPLVLVSIDQNRITQTGPTYYLENIFPKTAPK